MKRFALLAAVVAVVGATGATSALAKGASQATITGPRLGTGVTLAGEGQDGGGLLTQIAETAGFFPAVFLASPNPMLSARPQGTLGPRYTITYTMPGPSGVDEIRQDLYPYARPSPVVYTRPGQHYFTTETTVGGWYVATSALKDALVLAGLPKTAPVDGGGFEAPWAIAGAIAGAIVVLSAASVAALRLRRRHRPATA